MSVTGPRLTRAELDAESATALPARHVLSLLNLDVDLDLVLDLAAPIDLAVAANANVAAPIDAAVAADVLTIDSTAQALGTQDAQITQVLEGEALATADQDASLAQGAEPAEADGAGFAQKDVVPPVEEVVPPVADVVDPVGDAAGDAAAAVGEAIGGLETDGLLQDGLLNVNVDAAVDAALAAPIAGAVAANANVAAPISAAVAANIASIGSEATAVVDQTAVIVQTLEDVTADAAAIQSADVAQ